MTLRKKISLLLLLLFLSTVPVAISADINPGPAPTGIADISATGVMNQILNLMWPLFVGTAVIMLLVAGFSFLASMGDPAKVAAARLSVLWIIIGIVVGILAFSIPLIIRNTLGF